MASNESQAEAMAAVHNMIRPWSHAMIDRDWDKLLSMCTSDIVFMPEGQPSVSGDSIRPWLEDFPTVTEMSWDVDSLDASEDIAFLRGWAKQTFETDEGVSHLDGKYCDLMRREADGKWRFAVIIWNSNTAP